MFYLLFFYRFLHDPHIWTLKTIQERNVIIYKYYSFIPRTQPIMTVFNISRQAEKNQNNKEVVVYLQKLEKNHKYCHREINQN